jgi:hypothetical protein
MVTKASFTPEEWKQILQSPMVAGIAVSAAEPSGLFGTLKKGMASARELLAAKSDPSADELIKAVIADFETSEGRTSARDSMKSMFAGIKPADVKAKAIESLRHVSALLDTKAPADAAAFKTWLRHIAQSVAEAATSGGFLGFGGVAVSDAEKATFSEISTALNVSANV